MKKKALFIILLNIIFSINSIAIVTQEIPNARTLFKKEKNELNKIALLGTFLPIPILSTIFQAPSLWKNYIQCRKTYKLFKSANILINQNEHTKKDIKKAEKRLNRFLAKIKNDSIKNLNKPGLFNSSMESQKILDQKINKMSVLDLAKLFDDADKIIPPILGDPRFSYAKYDLDTLNYSIRVTSTLINSDPLGLSIFEKSIMDEEKLQKNRS